MAGLRSPGCSKGISHSAHVDERLRFKGLISC